MGLGLQVRLNGDLIFTGYANIAGFARLKPKHLWNRSVKSNRGTRSTKLMNCEQLIERQVKESIALLKKKGRRVLLV